MLALNKSWYEKLWDTMTFLPGKREKAHDVAGMLIEHRGSHYGRAVCGTYVPWYVVGVIHHMESDMNFTRQIVNGEKWNHVTRRYPVGVGPWVSWEDAARWALCNEEALIDFSKSGKTWPIWRILYRLECYNGVGYAVRHKNSPYLWAGSDMGLGVGKSVKEKRPDGGYDVVYHPEMESSQIGAALVLKALESDFGVVFAEPEG